MFVQLGQLHVFSMLCQPPKKTVQKGNYCNLSAHLHLNITNSIDYWQAVIAGIEF